MERIIIFESPCGYLTRSGATRKRAVVADPLAQRVDGGGLVQLDADDGLLGAEQRMQDLEPAQQRLGPLYHDPVVVGEKGLALGAVGDQVLDLEPSRSEYLTCAGSTAPPRPTMPERCTPPRSRPATGRASPAAAPR
jgi:hypothetical protein